MLSIYFYVGQITTSFLKWQINLGDFKLVFFEFIVLYSPICGIFVKFFCIFCFYFHHTILLQLILYTFIIFMILAFFPRLLQQGHYGWFRKFLSQNYSKKFYPFTCNFSQISKDFKSWKTIYCFMYTGNQQFQKSYQNVVTKIKIYTPVLGHNLPKLAMLEKFSSLILMKLKI